MEQRHMLLLAQMMLGLLGSDHAEITLFPYGTWPTGAHKEAILGIESSTDLTDEQYDLLKSLERR